MFVAERTPIVFLADSRACLRRFPESARSEAGVQLYRVQLGLEPMDWKPMSSVGAGVREIRVRDDDGAFRVLYLATRGEAVYVLHAFAKKTAQTSKHYIELGRRRLKEIPE